MENGGIAGMSGSYTWSFPVCPHQVRIALRLVGALQHDVAAAPQARQGLLYGNIHPGLTEINGCEPLPSLAPDAIAPALAVANRPVVGYYRVRNGRAFIPGADEIHVADEYFKRAGAVVLLVQRRDDGPAEATFFFRRGEALVCNLPHPFPIDPAILAAEEAAHPAGGADPLGRASGPHPARRGGLGRLRFMRALSAQAGVIVALVLLSAFLAATFLWPPRSAPEDVADDTSMPAPVSADESAGDLVINWNPQAVATAISGTLKIDAGGVPRLVPLDSTELRVGRVLYSSIAGPVQAGDVKVRLTALQPDGTSVDVPVLAHMAPVPPPAAPPPRFDEVASVPAPQAAPVTMSTPPPRPAPTPAADAAASPAPAAKAAPRSLTPERASPAPLEPETRPLQEPARTAKITAPPAKRFVLVSGARPAPHTPTPLDPPPPEVPGAVNAPLRLAPLVPVTVPAPAPALPTPAPAAPAPARMRMASSGRIIWTGTLRRGGIVQLNGQVVSIGSLSGGLPGSPVNVTVEPAEFTSEGLIVYTRDAARHNHVEPPSAANGWNRTTYIWDPERVKELAVLEWPTASNRYSRMSLRNDARRCSMILIDWKARAQ